MPRIPWSAIAVGLVWAGLATFQFWSAPGMNMDEAWSILSARGLWDPADPLSGMTRYSGPFPVLLLRLLGDTHGLFVLRLTGLLCNAVALALVVGLVRRAPESGSSPWPTLLVGGLPVWLAMSRNGIEIGMFGPALALGGLHALLHPTARSAFVGGLCFGVMSYSHVVHSFFVVSLALAWLVVYWRIPPIRWAPGLAGAAVGFAPRLVSLVWFSDRGLEGSAADYDLAAALADLPNLPRVFWDTLHGRTVYLRYVGRITSAVPPYYALAPLLVVPWLTRLREFPRHVLWVALTTVLLAIVTTVGALSLTVRFFVLPAIGFATTIVLLSQATATRFPRWRIPTWVLITVLTVAQLGWFVRNFTIPWMRDEAKITKFALGDRAPDMNSRAFVSKRRLVERLEAMDPQVVVSRHGSLQRPLAALMPDHRVLEAFPSKSPPPKGAAALVWYRSGKLVQRRCHKSGGKRYCFSHPEVVDDNFLVYVR